MNIKFTLAAMTCAVAISGCASPAAVPPQFPAKGANRADLSPDPTNYIHLHLNKECMLTDETQWVGTKQIKTCAAEKFRPQAGYYARVVGWWTPNSLTNDGKLQQVGIGAPDYDKERRTWLERLLWGENTTFSLVANIEVHSRLNYRAPIPLYSVSHSSGKEGEGFDVNLKDIWYSPLIRVTADTRLTTEVVAHYKKEIKTGAVSAALRVAEVAAGQLAPGGSLLTSLNIDQVRKEAKVWDTAISQMSSSDTNETRGGTSLAKTWDANKTVVVSLLAPGSSGAMMPERLIGSWSFTMEKPRMSLFSANNCLLQANIKEGCAKEVIEAITPPLVLNEMVGPDTTLIGALRKKDWYGQALIAMNAKNGNPSQFCQQVIQAADDFGLNAVDAKLLLWALQSGEPLGDTMRDLLFKDKFCQKQLKPFVFGASESIAVEEISPYTPQSVTPGQ
ncbi:hypothetical protein WV31_08675 [Magnetospirillum sp. ME-1]|uniref:hypothetical protein n=1 Tax=Magnetospirillum sp. ME-1 TaxID=1639348 RepID=UPI000A17D583|nr:hypothetical protein [Magnetospirillum sp. ME-1]ARJ65722.1 hypothetical protein WV31_08675 [Magnetospirillum sp. ME-1]